MPFDQQLLPSEQQYLLGLEPFEQQMVSSGQTALEADLPSDLELEPSEQQMAPSGHWALPFDQMQCHLGHLPQQPLLYCQLQLWPLQPLDQLLYYLQQQLHLFRQKLAGWLLPAGLAPLCAGLVQLTHPQHPLWQN